MFTTEDAERLGMVWLLIKQFFGLDHGCGQVAVGHRLLETLKSELYACFGVDGPATGKFVGVSH